MLTSVWVVTLGVALAVSLAVIAGHVASRTEADRLQRADDITRVIQASVATAAGGGEVEPIQRQVEALARSGSVLGVTYYDQRRDRAPAADGEPPPGFVLNALQRNQPVTRFGEESIGLARPIRVDGETVGVIAVEVPRYGRLELLGGLSRGEIGIGLLIALCGVLLVLASARSLAAPIERAARIADRVAAGDLSPTEPLSGGPEVRRLSLSLRHMVETIRRNTEQINLIAYRDPLTGLSNRADFARRGAATVQRLERAGDNAALLFIDLDGFKQVNDAYGHDAGDAVLKLFARRLHRAIRSTDQVVSRPVATDPSAVDDLVARIGGDEFAVMLHHVEGREDAAAVAERILGLLRQPFLLRETQIRLSASIGIAQAACRGIGFPRLLSAADTAMYDVKRTGKNSYRFAELASAA